MMTCMVIAPTLTRTSTIKRNMCVQSLNPSPVVVRWQPPTLSLVTVCLHVLMLFECVCMPRTYTIMLYSLASR
jgi:hypothetical protein